MALSVRALILILATTFACAAFFTVFAGDKTNLDKRQFEIRSPTSDQRMSLIKEVTFILEELRDAFASKNSAAAAELYTDDARFAMPGEDPIVGDRPALEKWFERTMAANVTTAHEIFWVAPAIRLGKLSMGTGYKRERYVLVTLGIDITVPDGTVLEGKEFMLLQWVPDNTSTARSPRHDSSKEDVLRVRWEWLNANSPSEELETSDEDSLSVARSQLYAGDEENGDESPKQVTHKEARKVWKQNTKHFRSHPDQEAKEDRMEQRMPRGKQHHEHLHQPDEEGGKEGTEEKLEHEDEEEDKDKMKREVRKRMAVKRLRAEKGLSGGKASRFKALRGIPSHAAIFEKMAERFEDFSRALEAKDVDGVLELMLPDIEFFVDKGPLIKGKGEEIRALFQGVVDANITENCTLDEVLLLKAWLPEPDKGGSSKAAFFVLEASTVSHYQNGKGPIDHVKRASLWKLTKSQGTGKTESDGRHLLGEGPSHPFGKPGFKSSVLKWKLAIFNKNVPILPPPSAK